MRQRIITSILLAAGLFAGLVRSVAAVPGSGYTVKSMGVAEGLGSQRAYKVCCDSDGALWVATIDGVDRWNGRTMKHYDLESNMKFSDASGRTISLAFDVGHRLHAYDNAGRIYRFDAMSDRFELYINIAEYEGDGLTVNSVCFDSRSKLWIGLSNGACRLDPETHELRWIVRDVFVTDVIELPHGMAVASTHGIHIFTREGTPLHRLCENVYMQSLYVMPDDGLLFAGTFSNGLRVIDLATYRVLDIPQLDLLPHTPVRSMLAQDESTLLAGFDGDGVYAVDLQTWRIAPQFTKANGLLNAMGVYSMCLDGEDDVWVATYTGGVTMLSREDHPVLLLQQPAEGIDGLSDNNVNSLVETSPGELWIATDDGVSVFDISDNSWRHILKGCVCLGITHDRKRGRVAVATYGNGVYVYDTALHRLAHYNSENSPMLSSYVPAVQYDGSGSLWVAQLDDDAMLLEWPSNRWRRLDVPKVRCLCEHGDSIMAAGMVDGIALIDKHTGEVRRRIDAVALAGHDVNTFVHAMAFVDEEHLWLGSDGGGLYLFNLDTGGFEQVTTENRLPSNRIYALVVDRNRNMWIGTDHGLSCMAAESDMSLYNLNYRREMRRSFNRSAACLLSDGRIAMGSTSGLLIFSPGISLSGHEPHVLRFTDFRIDNISSDEERKMLSEWNRMLEAGSVELSHRHNSFSVDIESICYRYSDDLAYRYCLEGFDNDWSPLSRNEHVQYKNLPPGDYVFRVRSYSINSGMQLDERNVGISIRYPWWLRWWAWIVYGLIVAVAVRSLWRYKRRKLQMRYMNEKMDFFVSIAHDIRTPLTLVKAPLDILDMDRNLDREARHQVGLARRNLHKLLEMLSQLFEVERMEHFNARPQCEAVSLGRVIDDMVTAFVPLCQHEGVELKVGDVPDGLYVEADVTLLNRILNNLLSNAVKYTPSGGRVRIFVEESRHTVRISVEDNGIGISDNEQQRLFTSFFRASNAINSQAPGTGLGLLQSKRFALMLGGDVTFTSQEGKGSTFTLTLRRSDAAQQPECEHDEHDGREADASEIPTRDTILVVDDNEGLRQFLYEIFSPEYRVVLRSDAVSALKYLETDYPSIILSDVMMIGMQGDEMCRLIKNNPVTAGIPVLLLTAKSNSKSIIEGLEMGADDYIAKPFDVAVLKVKVHMHIANRHRLHQYYSKIALNRNDDNQVDQQDSDIRPNEADCDFVKKARLIVEQHLGDPDFDIKHLCREMAMCRTLFYERLKTLMGQTPQEFIRMIRLDHAEMLLSQGEPVVDVAARTGFVNVKYFSTVFKKHYGVPPSRYHAKR